MNRLKDYIKKHIPETVCILITAGIFVAMSVYAIFLYIGTVSQDSNTFEEINNSVSLTDRYETESANNAESDGLCYVVGSGTKYHTSDCSYVKSGSVVTAFSIEQAKEKGYEPCSKCMK